MRASHQESIGGEGISRVKANFQRIKWGPAENPSHDLGTDLFVQAWDAPGFSRGLVIGVQVKAGPSYFERPLNREGQIVGWWYRERNRDHFEEWTAHCLPHLLVLHDLDQDISYWVHVTADAVVSTGQGCKILVPKAQTIDPEHFDGLYAVACQQRAAPVLEGTSFHGLEGGIPPARLLRYALVAPRLVAPNPNAGHDTPISAVQGLALLAQGRFRSLKIFADDHPADMADPVGYVGDDWTWRFVSSMWDWAMTDSVDRLRTVFGSAATQDAKAASGVLLACALQRFGRHRQTLGVLDHLVDDDDLPPADHGWVLIQRARTKTEMGDIEDARRDALEAQRYLQGDEDDITVSALSAAAAWHLFITTDQLSRSRAERMSDFASLVTDSDTAVSWWRSQTVSWEFHDAANNQIRTWADGYSPPMYPGLQHLFAAELNADLTGEHLSWRNIAALSAKQKLVRSPNTKDPVTEIANGLDLLRRSGDEWALERALKRVILDGPLEAVTRVVNNIPPVDAWTHTTVDTNIRVLGMAGTFLERPAANEFVLSLASLVAEPLEFTNRLRPAGLVPIYALKAINRLLTAAGEQAHNTVARLVASLPVSQFSYLQHDLPMTLGILDPPSVEGSLLSRLWEIAQQHHDQLGAAALGWLAANNHPGAESELQNRAASGDLHALGTLGNEVTVLDDNQAAAVISMFESKTRRTLVNARRGKYQLSGRSPVWWVTFLNVSFPAQACWDAVTDLLVDPMVAWTDKRQAGWLIAHMPHKLPTTVHSTLAANSASIAVATEEVGNNTRMGGLGTVLAITLGALQGPEADIEATKLVCGSAQEGEDGARLLGLNYCPSLQPTLAALIGHPQPDVRRQAACAVGQLLVTDPSTLINLLAWELAEKDGTLLPKGLIAGMHSRSGPLSTLATEIAQHLTQHPSARIRKDAWDLLS